MRRSKRKTERVRRAVVRKGSWSAKGMGRRSATSTSKIKNTTASKKNRSEKGVRAEFLGSNPHSNGAWVSIAVRCRDAVIKAIRVSSLGTMMARAKIGAKMAMWG